MGKQKHNVQKPISWLPSVKQSALKRMKRNISGHPTTIFGKYLFGRRFEIYNFRNIFSNISCLSASPRIFEHLKNGIIDHF